MISGKNENINVKCVTDYSKKCPIFAAKKSNKMGFLNTNNRELTLIIQFECLDNLSKYNSCKIHDNLC